MAYSCVAKDDIVWYRRLFFNIISQGPLPKHIALILNGNRRFAKKVGLQTKGHTEGVEKLRKLLRWSTQLGIKEITVYIFSIENFRRPQEEVEQIFQLTEDALKKMLQDKKQLADDGVCYQSIGDISMIPPSLLQLGSQLLVATRHNSRVRVNVALAYTSRNEIARGVEVIHEGVTKGELFVEDITQDLLSQTFQILPNGYPVDLLIRTSGEQRLSDFLLWQTSESVLHFIGVLWPEFSAWNLLSIIFEYQKNYFSIKKLNLRKESLKDTLSNETLVRQNNFISKYRSKMWSIFEKQAEIPMP